MASVNLPLGRKLSVKTSRKDNGGRKARSVCVTLKGKRRSGHAK